MYEIKRGDLVAFIGDYATRPGKADAAQAAPKKGSSATAPASKHSGNEVKARAKTCANSGCSRAHWSTFNLADHDWDEPIRRTTAAATRAGVHLVTQRVGEWVDADLEFRSTPWWEAVR